jgi:uncharacterized membrane protein YhaH (DUF805 family)
MTNDIKSFSAKIFSMSPIGRLNFCALLSIPWVLIVTALFAAGQVAPKAMPFVIYLSFVFVPWHVLLVLKRNKDIGWSPGMIWLHLVPGVNFWYFGSLITKKGKSLGGIHEKVFKSQKAA